MKFFVFVGGGCVFGLKLCDYLFKLNKKVKCLVCILVLIYKVKENVIIVLEDFNFEVLKIKNFVDLLKNFNFLDKKMLVVLGDINKNVYLLFCNLECLKVVIVFELNIYDIVNV